MHGRCTAFARAARGASDEALCHALITTTGLWLATLGPCRQDLGAWCECPCTLLGFLGGQYLHDDMLVLFRVNRTGRGGESLQMRKRHSMPNHALLQTRETSEARLFGHAR